MKTFKQILEAIFFKGADSGAQLLKDIRGFRQVKRQHNADAKARTRRRPMSPEPIADKPEITRTEQEPKRRIFTDDHIKTVYNMRSNKASWGDIEKATKFTRPTIRKIVDSEENKKRPDYVPHIHSQKHSPELIKSMYAHRKAGKTDVEIARIHKISYSKHLSDSLNASKDLYPDHFHPQQKVPRISTDVYRQVHDMHMEDGLTYRQIGKKLGMTRLKVGSMIDRVKKGKVQL